MFIKRFALAVLLVVLSAGIVQADNWSFTLNNPDQQGAPGATLTYSVTITNTTGAALPLTSFDLNPPDGTSNQNFSINFDPNFNNAVLNNGSIPINGYSGNIFSIQIQPAATIGAYQQGLMDLVTDVPGSPPDLNQTFSATVNPSMAPVPEPSSLVTFALGFSLLAILWLAKRSRRRRLGTDSN